MNLLRKNDLIMLGLSLVIFAILQVLITTKVLTSFWELNLIIIGINVIMAVSLNLINGYTGQFSLGHAGFMGVGAFSGVILATMLKDSIPSPVLRLVLAIGGLGMMIPGTLTDVVGLALVAAVIVYQKLRAKKNSAPQVIE